MSYPPQPGQAQSPPYGPPQQSYGYPQQQQPYGQPAAPQQPYGVPQPSQPYGQQPPPERPRRRGLKAVLIVLGTFLGLIALGAGFVVYHISTRPGPVDLSGENNPYEKVAAGMTAALAAKDEEAFVKPFKSDELKAKQRKVFRNLVKVPWEQAHWEPQFAAPLNGDMWVTFVHQIKGVDSKPVGETYNWRVEPGVGAPVITEVGGTKGLTGKTSDNNFYPGPWDVYEDLAVETREHLVVVSDKSQTAELQRDADILAQAAKDDLDAWQKSGRRPPCGQETARGYFIVLEKQREVYNRLYRGDGRENDSLEAGVNMPIPVHDPLSTSKDKESGGSRIVMDTSLSRFTGPDWKNGVAEIGQARDGPRHRRAAQHRDRPGGGPPGHPDVGHRGLRRVPGVPRQGGPPQGGREGHAPGVPVRRHAPGEPGLLRGRGEGPVRELLAERSRRPVPGPEVRRGQGVRLRGGPLRQPQGVRAADHHGHRAAVEAVPVRMGGLGAVLRPRCSLTRSRGPSDRGRPCSRARAASAIRRQLLGVVV